VISKYPATTVAILGLLIFGAAFVILAAPGLHADPAQAAILVGVLVVAIQQVISQRTNEANGHRLTAVENVADLVTARVTSAGIPLATPSETPPETPPETLTQP